MSKRTLMMVVALIACLAIAATGTLAYLTDSDMDVNVMTLGNVDIVQNEQERTEEGELDEFTQNKPLYPAVFEGSSIPWAPEDEWVVPGDEAWKVVEDNENVVDKFVTVTNTGKSDAYVRTIIAYEGDETYGPEGAYIHVVHNGTNVDPDIAVELMGTVDIDGVTYTVYSYTYPEALASGETTIPSLKQLYMNKAADNDVVAQYGDTYDVLVLSQAAQLQGFADAKTALDTAFGEVNAENVQDWFANATIGTPGAEGDTNNPPTVVDTATELSDALAQGGTVMLGGDVTAVSTVSAGTTSLNLNQNTISGSLMLEDGAELTVEDGAIVNTDNSASAIAVPAGATAELNNVTIESARHGIRAEGGDVTINGGTYKIVPDSKMTLHAVNVSDGSTVTINGGTFVGPKGTIADSGAAVNVQAGSTVIIYDGNFSGGKNNTLACKGTLTIYGGTFDQDPSAYVPAGYKVTKNGDVYTVSAE